MWALGGIDAFLYGSRTIIVEGLELLNGPLRELLLASVTLLLVASMLCYAPRICGHVQLRVDVYVLELCSEISRSDLHWLYLAMVVFHILLLEAFSLVFLDFLVGVKRQDLASVGHSLKSCCC